jgi:hypothetical protein
MRVILSGRKTSRTTTLIELCAEAEVRGEVSYIVCHSREAAQKIFQKAEELSKNIGFPITYDEFIDNKYSHRNIKNFFIDNADHLLQSLTPVRIDTVVLEREDPVG